MNTPRLSSRSRQQGIITLMAVIFLITAVIFALSQTLNITASNSMDNNQQMKSEAAFFLAESGLERSMSILKAAGGQMSEAACTGISTNLLCGTGSIPLGNDSYCYPSVPVAVPSGCSGGNCDSCTVSVTGNQGSASRTVSLTVKISSIFGVSGNGGSTTAPACTLGSPIQLSLKNNYNGQYPGTAIFSLGIVQHSTGQPVNPVSCSNLTELFYESSSQGAGQNSLFNYSDYTLVLLNQTTVQSAIHGFTKSEDYSLVGAIFPNTDVAGTTPLGKYWNSSSSSNSTVLHNNSPTYPNGYIGYTNSGVAGGATACTTPDLTHENTTQTCTNWCMNTGTLQPADTLVYNFSAFSTGLANSLTDVKFNTAGSNPQNISLTKLVHFPNSTATGTATDIYADIWYLYNKSYASENLTGAVATPATSALGAGATSYPTAVKGTVGATVNNTSTQLFTKAVRNIMTVNSISSGALSIGDKVSPGDSKLDSTVTITAVPANFPACLSASPWCVYTFSGNVYTGSSNNYNPTNLTTQSTKLIIQGYTGSSNLTGSQAGTLTNITTATNNFFNSAGTASYLYIQSGTNATSYTVSSSAPMASPYTPVQGRSNGTIYVTQGPPTTTITLPTGASAIDSSYVGTYVAVYNGNGSFPQQTKISAVTDSTHFTVDNSITNGISGAIVCGGICAFFDTPSNQTSNTTQFKVYTNSTGTQDWASGFTCLYGVQADKIYAVPASTTSSATTWHEEVQ